MKFAIMYAIFALIATVANIAAQELSIRIYQSMAHIPISLIIGTGVGLVVKYMLDKRYIFQFKTRDVAHGSSTFLLYSLMGLITTALFWGMELGFHQLFATKEMRYLGGILGLAAGYVIKYQLDKRFVFRRQVA